MFSVFSMKKKDLLKLNSNFQPELCSAEINWLQSVGRSVAQPTIEFNWSWSWYQKWLPEEEEEEEEEEEADDDRY